MLARALVLCALVPTLAAGLSCGKGTVETDGQCVINASATVTSPEPGKMMMAVGGATLTLATTRCEQTAAEVAAAEQAAAAQKLAEDDAAGATRDRERKLLAAAEQQALAAELLANTTKDQQFDRLPYYFGPAPCHPPESNTLCSAATGATVTVLGRNFIPVANAYACALKLGSKLHTGPAAAAADVTESTVKCTIPPIPAAQMKQSKQSFGVVLTQLGEAVMYRGDSMPELEFEVSGPVINVADTVVVAWADHEEDGHWLIPLTVTDLDSPIAKVEVTANATDGDLTAIETIEVIRDSGTQAPTHLKITARPNSGSGSRMIGSGTITVTADDHLGDDDHQDVKNIAFSIKRGIADCDEATEGTGYYYNYMLKRDVYCLMDADADGGRWNLCGHLGLRSASGGQNHWYKPGGFTEVGSATRVEYENVEQESAFCGIANVGSFKELMFRVTDQHMNIKASVAIKWDCEADCGYHQGGDRRTINLRQKGGGDSVSSHILWSEGPADMTVATSTSWENSNEAFTEHFYLTYADRCCGTDRWYELGNHNNGYHQHYEESCEDNGSTGSGQYNAGSFGTGGCDSNHWNGGTASGHVFVFYRN